MQLAPSFSTHPPPPPPWSLLQQRSAPKSAADHYSRANGQFLATNMSPCSLSSASLRPLEGGLQGGRGISMLYSVSFF